MDLTIPLAGVAAAALAAVVYLLRWAMDRVGVLVDEMIQQDYQSFAERAGNAIVWLAARRTPTPLARFEEWMSHMLELRRTTGRPCLPDALHFLIRSSEVGPLDHAAPGGSPSPQPPPDPQFAATVLDEIYRLWLEPELRARGLAADRQAIAKAVVVMPPGGQPEVRVNDEASWVATLRAKRAIERGEELTTDDVDFDDIGELWPENVDVNAAWTGFVTVAGRLLIAFDFRRNRGTAHATLGRARQELDEARRILSAGRFRGTIEHLYKAADLAVIAELFLHDDRPPEDPDDRRRRFRGWAQLGNAPRSHSHGFDRLAHLRAENGRPLVRLRVRRSELDELVAIVEQMLGRVGDAVGQPTQLH